MKEPWYVVHTLNGSPVYLSAPFGSPALRRWVTKLDDVEPMTRRKAEKFSDAVRIMRQAKAMSHSQIVALVVCGE